MRQAWGYFLTPDEIPKEKLQAYNLVSADAVMSKWQSVAEKISDFSKKSGDDMESEDILPVVTSGNLEEVTGYLVRFSKSKYQKETIVDSGAEIWTTSRKRMDGVCIRSMGCWRQNLFRNAGRTGTGQIVEHPDQKDQLP